MWDTIYIGIRFFFCFLMDIRIRYAFAFFFFKMMSEFIEVWKTYVLIVHVCHDSIFETKRERERERERCNRIWKQKKKKKNQNKREIDKKITKEVTYKPYLYHLCTDLSLLVSSFGTEHMYTLFVFIHTNACFGHKSQTQLTQCIVQ